MIKMNRPTQWYYKSAKFTNSRSLIMNLYKTLAFYYKINLKKKKQKLLICIQGVLKLFQIFQGVILQQKIMMKTLYKQGGS